MNIEKIRRDFPILNREGKPIIYFDNACMTLRPQAVIDSVMEYYTDYPACALRSLHKLSKTATEKVEDARRRVRKFIGAKSENEIIFTRNTTESINLIANSFDLKKGDIVLTSDKEHNSNNIPWQAAVKKKGIIKKTVFSKPDNTFSIENFEKEINSKVKLVSFVHTSNMDGVTTPAKEIIRIAHDHGARVLLDAAQSIPHKDVDVRKFDADFLAFSGHKMMGPSGIGVLYGKEDELNNLSPFIVGGETVKDSTYETCIWEESPAKFEGGLQNYAGILGLGAACSYVDRIGKSSIERHDLKLNSRLTEKTSEIEGLEMIGPKDSRLRSGIFNFNIKGINMHDIAMLSDSLSNISIRSGAHCAHSWFNARKMEGSARASLYIYNTEEEVDKFVDTLKEIAKVR